ncbi:MAG: efflux RND transporter periplasmic adaptor subunit [Acidobacteriota bacterium]|nr:efflux RND transporter periplasmic adaptor subunit [Acidobacteriota bacterium]
MTFFAVLGLIVMAAVVAGVLPRLRREKLLAAEAKTGQSQLPAVNVAAARAAPANAPLELPGDLRANVESPIFARADGYLVKRNADIGDRVKKGQVLADLETPELDQQIQQARATISNSQSTLKELQAALGLANANLNLAQATYRRWESLEKKGIMSHQDAEEKLGAQEIRKAEVEAASAKMVSERDLIAGNEANFRRLEQMKAYSHVTAPFDGIITARNVDIGTLINSGNGGTAKEMFRIAEIATMRIFVNVPQSYVGAIHDGEKGEVRVQEQPGRVFHATVARFTHEVDTGSRSMLAILLAPNPKEVLLPGMYAQVRFSTARANSALLIPGDALVTGSKGTRVALVDAENLVHFREVRVGIDYGTEVEILSGLAAGDLVVMNPTDSVREGAQVEVRKTRESGR